MLRDRKEPQAPKESKDLLDCKEPQALQAPKEPQAPKESKDLQVCKVPQV